MNVLYIYTYINITEEQTTWFFLMMDLFYYHRRTTWLHNSVKNGMRTSSAESVRELATGATRIRGQTLGIVGLGLCLKLYGYMTIQIPASWIVK